MVVNMIESHLKLVVHFWSSSKLKDSYLVSSTYEIPAFGFNAKDRLIKICSIPLR
jgi:hypothetical protein